MSNRVEQLETTVSELESTIEGLTEELVETKERLRVIESQLDVDAADVVQPAPVDDGADVPTKEAAPDEVEEAVEADKGSEDQESAEAEGSGSGLGDDIIVA